jgi:hypothetical protein
VVFANDRFRCIYAPHGGEHKIHLGNSATVVDAFDNAVVSANSADFYLSMPAHSARLLVLK